jgi:hypothetical protein
MRVLVACECSGIVREAFRKRGHDAWSCDIKPAEDISEYHIQADVLTVLDQGWDMMIAFPPCTHLASCGSKFFAQKRADGRQDAALDFVIELMNADIPRIAIENPIGVISTRVMKPTQVIQPFEYGHGETKATCLWLWGLPKLKPTNIVSGRFDRTSSIGTRAGRDVMRSRTYQGIADAMAEQWGIEL